MHERENESFEYFMTLQQLDLLIPKLLAKHGDMEIAIDWATFSAPEDGTILVTKNAEVRELHSADDSDPGTAGPKYPFLVLTGE